MAMMAMTTSSSISVKARSTVPGLSDGTSGQDDSRRVFKAGTSGRSGACSGACRSAVLRECVEDSRAIREGRLAIPDAGP